MKISLTEEERRRKEVYAFLDALKKEDKGENPVVIVDGMLRWLLMEYDRGISARQVEIFATKWIHGFNLDPPYIDMAKLVGKVSEALEALALVDDTDTNESQEDRVLHVVKELADVVIYCYGIAQMLDYDLDSVINSKMKYNIERAYGTAATE